MIFKKKKKKKKKKRLRYFIYHTCPLHTNDTGCGKIEAHKNWSMVKPEKVAPVTGITLRTTGPVAANSWQYIYIYIYIYLVTTYSKRMVNRVRLPIILLVVSRTGKMNILLSPYAPENLVSPDGFSRPVPRQPAHSLYSG